MSNIIYRRKSNFSYSRKSLSIISGVDSDMQKIAHRAIEISPIDFGIPSSGGHRTAEEQNKLFVAGASKCDGYKKKSRHQTGLALDFYAYVDGAASWDPYHLSLIACAFLQASSELGYKLEWGGLWTSFSDMPHVQIVK